MKRNLLFVLLSVLISISANAQFNSIAPKRIDYSKIKKEKLEPVQLLQEIPYNYEKSITSSKGTVSRVLIGRSPNAFSVTREGATCLTSNNDLNTIMFSHRYLYGSNTGYIRSSFSTDGGTTWDTTLTLYGESNPRGRYPSGVIYNPSGNTNIDSAYAVVCGPTIEYPLDTVWKGNYYSSIRFDSTNSNMVLDTFPDTISASQRNLSIMMEGLSATNDGKFHYMSLAHDDDGEYFTKLRYRLFTGYWNNINKKADWLYKDFEPSLTRDAEDHQIGSVYETTTAWSNDGTIGYVILLGRDSANDPLAFQPIVYKTENSGTNWNQMTDNVFDTISTIIQHIPATINGNTKRAYFTDIKDAAVDVNGNLHIACFITGAYSDHADSLSYIWVYGGIGGYMFDVFTVNGGGWNSILIDTLFFKNIPAFYDPYAAGADSMPYTERLQISKSPDEEKLFYVWTDTDKSYRGYSLYNMHPEIFAKGYNVNTNLVTSSTKFTNGSENDWGGDCFFMYASNQSFQEDSNYFIPVTYSVPLSTSISTTSHYYVKGIEFTDNVFFGIGIEEINSQNKYITVFQNYPNPAKDKTSINFNLLQPSDVEFTLINTTGQCVITKNYGKMAIGNNQIDINVKNLSSGVYFYTLKTNKSITTNKMIVE